MSRIAYVNGRYLPHARRDGSHRGPRLSVRRRRLRSLRGAGRAAGRRAASHGAARALAWRTAHRACRCRWRRCSVVLRETVRRNRVRDGIVYLQVTRGVARRDHRVSAAPARRQSLVVTARSQRSARASSDAAAEGIAVITVPEIRWARVDIKIGRPAAERAGQAGGARAGRARGLVRRRAGLRHRRRIVECLDRQPRRHAGHAAARPRHPARHHAHRS